MFAEHAERWISAGQGMREREPEAFPPYFNLLALFRVLVALGYPLSDKQRRRTNFACNFVLRAYVWLPSAFEAWRALPCFPAPAFGGRASPDTHIVCYDVR